MFIKDKKFDIIVVILILVFSFFTILSQPINNLDEIWQYSFARNIVNGKIPYQDFNIIVTPLFSLLGSCFLAVFGDELVVMRVFTSLVLSLITFFAYMLFKKLKLDKWACVIFAFILFALISQVIIDYNCFILLVCEVIVLMEFNSLDEPTSIRREILKSIIAGLAIVTKHTMGFLICFIYIFYKFIYIKNKKDLKQFLQVVVYRTIGVLIPIIIFLFNLILSDSFFEFVNYCIMGISEFSNKVSYFELIKTGNVICILLAILVPINCVYHIIRFRNLDKENNVLTLFSIIMLVGLFPIADVQHLVIYAFMSIIQIIYNLYNNLLIDVFKDKKQRKIVIQIMSFSVVMYLVGISLNLISTCKSCYFSELNHYSYCLISKELEQEIEIIIAYMKEKEKEKIDVLILDSTASIYMIPNNEYNKDYDLFMNGNFGKDGVNKIICDIRSRNDTECLVLKDKNNLNYQTPIDVLNYVVNNYTKIGEVQRFEVYSGAN